MRRTRWWALGGIGLLVLAPNAARSNEHDKLPPGPIRDRHELMKSIGDQAQNVNDAFNVGVDGFDTGIIQRNAQAIAMSAHRIPDLFPKGSTDPNSRALPAIWEKWDTFVQLAKQLEERAQSLGNAAASGNDEKLKEKSDKMFATCKACHEQFRRPEKKKAH